MAKLKLPKKVGGVKVPKKLRKQAKKALELVDTQAARNLALAGLAVAAETFIHRNQASGTAKKAARAALKQAGNGKGLLTLEKRLDGLELGEVLRAAAAEGARRFLEGFEEGNKKKKAETAAPRRAKSAAPRAAKSGGPTRRKSSARPADAAAE